MKYFISIKKVLEVKLNKNYIEKKANNFKLDKKVRSQHVYEFETLLRSFKPHLKPLPHYHLVQNNPDYFQETTAPPSSTTAEL